MDREARREHLRAVAIGARLLMEHHRLVGWRFQWSRARTTFGLCMHGRKVITLSWRLAARNSLALCLDVALHEIAHALVGKRYGHGPVWRLVAQRIGAQGTTCWNAGKWASEAVKVPGNWIAECPGCGRVYRKHRRPRKRYGCGRGHKFLSLTWRKEVSES
jgi:SprT-like family